MATNDRLPYYNDLEISAHLSWNQLLPVLERGLKQYSRHSFGVIQPVRTTFSIPQHSSLFFAMPCYSEHDDVICTKMLTVNPNNVGKGIPSYHAIIQLFRASTGQPLAVLDGAEITEWRTAGCSAISTKLLVNGTPRILAILGAGLQARSHFKALNQLYEFSQVRVWNIRQNTAQKLVWEIEQAGRRAVLCNSAKEAVEDADVICTVTNASKPILELDWVKPGAHINAVGAARFDKQEIHPDLMRKAVVYVECSKAALQESGDIIQSGAKIFGEIGEVLDGRKEAKTEEITVFKSLGMSIEDAVTATLVYNKIKAETGS